MTDSDISEVNKFFSHDSVTVISFSNLLELKFLPRAVVERWISARTLGEV
jgi:hypothetical protein